MTEKAKKFIYLLEREKAPIQDGYYYFDSSFFSNPSWYRLNNRIAQWQITFDLVKWYNVNDINIELNVENLYIVNYLKIKEIKNNIVIMNKNNEDFLNTMCNNIYIDVSKYQNEYNDTIISEIIQHINEANNNIINIKSQINNLELDYQLRANKKNTELLKRDLIYWNTQYHYFMEDYYKRLIYLKSNCIKNTDMFLGMYEDNKNELELMKNALSIMESKYNDKCYDYANLLKSNKNLIQDIKNAENYSTEQSIKISCLEIELKDKNDIIKNFKNEMNKKPSDIIAIQHLETKIFSLNFDNKNYLNKINNLESKINCFSEDTTNYKNKIDNLENKIKLYEGEKKYLVSNNNISSKTINELESKINCFSEDTKNYLNKIDNLENKIKFYEDQEKYLVENNNISNNKINELKLQVANLEKESDKLKMYSQNCICLSDITQENILKNEMNELRDRLSIETANKIKIINDAQILLNSKYTWNNDKQIFEENDYEILE
jgi:hypothetical protein